MSFLSPKRRGGSTPAYFSNFRMVDMLGYNDRLLARFRPTIRATLENPLAFVPGHNKFDAHYTLRQWRPDLVFQFWTASDAQLEKYRDHYDYLQRGEYWIRRGSPHERR